MSALRIGAYAVSLAAACLAAGPAFSHVTLETPQAPIGHSYKAVLRVPHGCQSSATTAIRVQIPEGLISVKPQPKAGWTIDLKQGKYEAPHTLYGRQVESGVREIAWSGGALPDDYYDEFVFVGYLSSDLTPGATLYLPVIQECKTGVLRWIDKPSGDAATDHAGTPSPALKLLPRQP
jgi:uncharacterized protein YcnI